MKTSCFRVLTLLCVTATGAGWCTTAAAQTAEVKEKPPLYTYESNWAIPRPHWPEFEKANTATTKILDAALARGTLVAYGDDAYVVHSAEGATHDNWFQGPSLASVLNTLDEIYKAGGAIAPVLATATKHWDGVYVSRYYNWRPGSWKGAYLHWAQYQLKADAPDDAVDVVAKSFVVPLMEKLLADGVIVEYEIDSEAIHSNEPGMFAISYISTNAEGLDKVNAALRDGLRKTPLAGPAFGSFVDFTKHRDSLVRTSATYK